MEESINEYRPAPDFEPYRHMDAIKGIAEALYWLSTEGPGTERILSTDTRATLNGLVWIQEKLVNELYAWLSNIENLTTCTLPTTAEDFEAYHLRHTNLDGVREPAAMYVINGNNHI